MSVTHQVAHCKLTKGSTVHKFSGKQGCWTRHRLYVIKIKLMPCCGVLEGALNSSKLGLIYCYLVTLFEAIVKMYFAQTIDVNKHPVLYSFIEISAEACCTMDCWEIYVCHTQTELPDIMTELYIYHLYYYLYCVLQSEKHKIWGFVQNVNFSLFSQASSL